MQPRSQFPGLFSAEEKAFLSEEKLWERDSHEYLFTVETGKYLSSKKKIGHKGEAFSGVSLW